MNKVILIGRLTKEPEMKQGNNDLTMCRFTLAVQRSYKNKDGNYDADFIQCSAYRSNAEFICKYFHKGSQIVVEGEWRTGSYEKDGVKVYTNECVVNHSEFCGSKSDNEQAQTQKSSAPATNDTADDDFVKIDTSKTGDLPFFG